MKLALETYDPMLVAFSRVTLAALVFLMLWRYFGRIDYRVGDWKWLVLMAFFEPFLYFVMETQALRFTSSAAAATIIALLPLSVAIAARFILQERLTGRLWTGLTLAVGGALLVTWSGEATDTAPAPLLGNALEFLAMLAAVGYTLMVKQLSNRYSAFFLTAVQSFVGSVLFLPPLLLTNGFAGAEWSWQPVAAIVYLGAIVSVLAYLMFNHALSQMPASKVSVFTSLIPVFAAGFGWLLLGERIGLIQGLGILLVVAGLLYGQRSTREALAPASAPADIELDR
jgi:drug/metabolite transporter (DMT)-like permease